MLLLLQLDAASSAGIVCVVVIIVIVVTIIVGIVSIVILMAYLTESSIMIFDSGSREEKRKNRKISITSIIVIRWMRLAVMFPVIAVYLIDGRLSRRSGRMTEHSWWPPEII